MTFRMDAHVWLTRTERLAGTRYRIRISAYTDARVQLGRDGLPEARRAREQLTPNRLDVGPSPRRRASMGAWALKRLRIAFERHEQAFGGA